jgi:nitronate monooxygenase
MSVPSNPIIIQGGMGAGVSAWQLAKAVSRTGQLGVVSGTALDTILSRRLQLGDPGGHMRRALAEFPLPEMAQRIVDRHFIPGGKSPRTRFRMLPLLTHTPSQEQLELIVVSNFVEVFLAKEDHDGLVGINYLEKIQLPTLPSLFGAMMAGVDYVLMGAGIPTAIPGALDELSEGNAVRLSLKAAGAQGSDSYAIEFDPRGFTQDRVPWMRRPQFLPIVASATLATMLSRKANGRVDGFVVEGPTAGGHNAPPRGPMQLNQRGEPIYGDRDLVDLEAMRALELPFWLAGSYGSPEQVVHALASGAAGVQVGTAFAFCDESGLRDDIKRSVICSSRDGELDVLTDPVASPAGFPFKVLAFDGSLSDTQLYQRRQRHCDLGYLRQAYQRPNGTLGWRCPAEPIDRYVRKGGEAEDTVGRKCICNALVANIGLEQVRSSGERERPLITCGDDVRNIHRFLPRTDAFGYTAKDVVRRLLSLVGVRQQALCSR